MHAPSGGKKYGLTKAWRKEEEETMNHDEFLTFLGDNKACAEGVAWVTEHACNLSETLDTCPRPDWLLWLINLYLDLADLSPARTTVKLKGDLTKEQEEGFGDLFSDCEHDKWQGRLCLEEDCSSRGVGDECSTCLARMKDLLPPTQKFIQANKKEIMAGLVEAHKKVMDSGTCNVVIREGEDCE